MHDSQLKKPERKVQRSFSKLLIMLAFLLAARDSRDRAPDRVPMPERTVAVQFAPLDLGAAAGPVRLSGAWQVSAADPRFFGLSALVTSPGQPLLAVSDSGVLVDLPRPGTGTTVRLRDLPAGPGFPTFKKYRDSEALLAEPAGMTVTFEFRHSLWTYPVGGKPRRFALPSAKWSNNAGIEAMVRWGPDSLMLMPEDEDFILLFRAGGGSRRVPLSGRTGGIADATRLPDGRIVVAVREIGPGGISNRLAWLQREGAGFRLVGFAHLPLGPLDNVEGLAAEPMPGGATRLWAVTDNDGWRRTLLLRMELTAESPRRDANGQSGPRK